MNGLRGEFVQTSSGRLLLVHNQVKGQAGVLILPPFGDEMNKCRATLAEFAMQTSQPVYLLDLFGTGDSEGEFVDATLETWHTNLVEAVAHIQANGGGITQIVALRFGCLLFPRVSASLPNLTNLILLQPIADGSTHVRQLKRMLAARQLTEAETAAFDGEQPVNCGGYEISPTLWDSMSTMSAVDAFRNYAGHVTLIEISGAPERGLSVPGKKLVSQFDRALSVTTQVLPGAPFWMSTEVIRNLAVVELIRGVVE